jgi:hypothetical protein
VAEPETTSAEAVRMLRTNVPLSTLDRDVRTIRITRSTDGEGKSTTAANLAIARAGDRVSPRRPRSAPPGPLRAGAECTSGERHVHRTVGPAAEAEVLR